MTATARRAARPSPTTAPIPPHLARLGERWPAARPFLVIGTLAIVAGGGVAAATRPTGLVVGSWLAAYLVLVAGIAQVVVGMGWAWLPSTAPDRTATATQVALWNVGVAGTVVATLVEAPLATAVAGGVLLAALVRSLRRTWTWDRSASPAWLARAHLALLVVVAVSTPIGSLLAWVRHG